MRKIILGTLTILGLIVATIASASPAIPLLGRDTVASASPIERAYYYWNHHRYNHRAWDRRRRRWRYY